jgi:hypothetical protein
LLVVLNTAATATGGDGGSTALTSG